MRTITLFWVVVFTGTSLYAQEATKADSIYQDILESYSERYSYYHDKEDRNGLDSLLALRALELAELYEKYPETVSAQKGLVSAFRAWLNVDSLDTMASYIKDVSPDDDLWGKLIPWYDYALQNNNVNPDVYHQYLSSILKTESVTNPSSLTYIYTELAKLEWRVYENIPKAVSHYERVIDLNADSIDVEFAKRDLYDIRNLQVGNKIPQFTVVDIAGDTVSIEDLEGKYVLIEFWATWCGPCMPEIPYLKEVYEKYGEREDFEMLGVSLDLSRDKLIPFLEEEEITWTQILDNNGKTKWTGQLANLFAVGNGIPKSFLIGKDGDIIEIDLRKEGLDEVLSSYLD